MTVIFMMTPFPTLFPTIVIFLMITPFSLPPIPTHITAFALSCENNGYFSHNDSLPDSLHDFHNDNYLNSSDGLNFNFTSKDNNNNNKKNNNDVSALIENCTLFENSITQYECLYSSLFPLHTTNFKLMKLQNAQLAKNRSEAQCMGKPIPILSWEAQ